ncbi:unnamed protein product [Acanthoscelides obtectus]|uniref:Uncharacterized protein n=1 Tax=Acanthoscelides obtectus TaxID=200917 RepID=A0A9P0LD53_ACAOB|nr:unnamed protein product [Acanthoscelides obtectus]CAK1671800.1 hypothetical protein AOBTE_LOCUS28469 [Acanthoscelides obtectus]
MRLTPRYFQNMSKMLDFYSQFNPSPLSIKKFIDFGQTPWLKIDFPNCTACACIYFVEKSKSNMINGLDSMSFYPFITYFV